MNHAHIVNLGMNMINNMKNNETVHYHVLGGLHGCMPSFNEVYDHIETSKDRLSDIINDFEDSSQKSENIQDLRSKWPNSDINMD